MDKEVEILFAKLAAEIDLRFAALEHMISKMGERLSGIEDQMSECLSGIEGQLSKAEQTMTDFDDRLNLYHHQLQKLDNLQPLIRHPKSFQAATKIYSVSMPVRRRLGQAG